MTTRKSTIKLRVEYDEDEGLWQIFTSKDGYSWVQLHPRFSTELDAVHVAQAIKDRAA